MTMALEGGEESASRPVRSLPLGKTWYPMYRRLGGPQGRSGQVRKISPPPGFDPWTVQPVANRFVTWLIKINTCELLGCLLPACFLVCSLVRSLWLAVACSLLNPYPTAFPYGNGMVLHFYQQQESSTTKTVHKVINKRLKAYV